MKTAMISALALAFGAMGFGAIAAEMNDTYIRKGDQEIVVFTHEGKLFCRRASDQFEMCYGMEKQTDGTFQGANMKHPDMPKFMTFNGTVVIGGNAKLSIKGCAAGQSLCDEEIWDKK